MAGGRAWRGGHAWQGAYVAGRGMHATADTTGYGQRAGGTHPTGMHSCYSRRRYYVHIAISANFIITVKSSKLTFLDRFGNHLYDLL